MAWVSNNVIRRRVASVVGVGNPDDLPSQYDVAIEDGNERAYHWLRERLINRGYTAAQLETWAAKEIWNKDAGVYFALEMLGLDSDEALSARRELYNRLFGEGGVESIALIDTNGDVIEVGSTGTSNISYGDAYVDEDDGTINMDTVL